MPPDPIQSTTMLLLASALVLLATFVLRRRSHSLYRVRLGRGVAWGTVYVFRDRLRPDLVKVGTTRRASRTRKREVSRTMADGADLVQVWAIDMPQARAVETVAHRLLRRHRARWQRGENRGREWYRLPDADLVPVLDAIEDAARQVRAHAQLRNRWPVDGDQRARIWHRAGGAAQYRYPFGRSRPVVELENDRHQDINTGEHP